MTETSGLMHNVAAEEYDATLPVWPPDAEKIAAESAQVSYRYRNADLQVIWHTSVPKDNEAALAYFHKVVRFGPEYNPVYVERITRNGEGGEEKVTMLPYVYDAENYAVKPFKS